MFHFHVPFQAIAIAIVFVIVSDRLRFPPDLSKRGYNFPSKNGFRRLHEKPRKARLRLRKRLRGKQFCVPFPRPISSYRNRNRIRNRRRSLTIFPRIFRKGRQFPIGERFHRYTKNHGRHDYHYDCDCESEGKQWFLSYTGIISTIHPNQTPLFCLKEVNVVFRKDI